MLRWGPMAATQMASAADRTVCEETGRRLKSCTLSMVKGGAQGWAEGVWRRTPGVPAAGHHQEGEGLQLPALEAAEGRGVDTLGGPRELQSTRQRWVGKETEGRKLSRIKYSYPGLYVNLSPLIRAF